MSSGKIFPVPATHSRRANHRPRTLQGTLAPTKGVRRCALLPGLPAPDAPAGSRLPTHWPLPTPDEPLGTVTRQRGLRTDSLTSFSSMGWGPRGKSEQLRFRDLPKKGKGTPAIPPAQSKYLSPLCRASPQFLALSNFPTSPWVEGIIPRGSEHLRDFPESQPKPESRPLASKPDPFPPALSPLPRKPREH